MRHEIACILALILVGCRGQMPCCRQGHGGRPVRPAPVRPFRIQQPDVVLLITGGTDGMLEVCNCAESMPGGLTRRSGLVRSYRAAFGNAFLLDSGDLFWVEPEDLRNDYVLQGYERIGYDAVVLGDREWAVPPARLERLLAVQKMPYLSTTVAPAGDGPDVLIRQVVTRYWPACKLAVLSYAGREAFHFSQADLERLSFRPADAVGALAAWLKRSAFVVVLVVHGDERSVQAVAENIPADLIVRGHTRESDPQLRTVAGRPVVKVGGYAAVGAVAMKVDSGGKLLDLEYRLEGVDNRWPADPGLMEIYQAYAHAAMRRALDAKREKGIQYAPSAACGRCHAVQYHAWRKSAHAGAYKTLAKSGRAGDPSCLMCHTTGFGTEHGFSTISKTPELAAVNCQNCHRFNVAEHRKSGFARPRVSEDICTSCHTPVTDPKFNFKDKFVRARCPHD